jgi:hypothetical protein
MRAKKVLLTAAAAALMLVMFAPGSHALTADEIVQKAISSHYGETLRAVVRVTDFKGSKEQSKHVLWLIVQVEEAGSVVFMDFTEPPESKGLRLLCRIKLGKKPQAYMYLPASEQTVQVDVDDPSTDIGGTGLTIGDFQPLIPKEGEKNRLLREEKAEGLDCRVIEITAPDGKEKRLVWISKEQFNVVKVEQFGANGKLQRTLRVVEFFKTRKGRIYPREELVSIPGKTRIRVRQDAAVWGITIPEELLDPKTFGTFKWRM